jgi:hypothetical protein
MRLLDVQRFQRKTEGPLFARPGRNPAAFQELLDDINSEELQMVFESWHDRLCWIIEHDREDFRKWQIDKSAISWTKKNRGMFSLLFGHPVFKI